jgi:hypothetical protein
MRSKEVLLFPNASSFITFLCDICECICFSPSPPLCYARMVFNVDISCLERPCFPASVKSFDTLLKMSSQMEDFLPNVVPKRIHLFFLVNYILLTIFSYVKLMLWKFYSLGRFFSYRWGRALHEFLKKNLLFIITFQNKLNLRGCFCEIMFLCFYNLWQ